MTLLAILKKWALAANLSLLFLTSFTKIGLSFKNNVIFFFFFFNNRLVIENTSGTKANNSFLFLITSHVKVPYCSCMFPQLRYKNQGDRYTRTSDVSPWFHGSSYVNGSKLLQGKWCKTEQGWTVWRDLQNVPCLFLRTSCTVCLSEVWLVVPAGSRYIPVPKAIMLPRHVYIPPSCLKGKRNSHIGTRTISLFLIV